MQYTNRDNIPELYAQAIIAGSEEYDRGESDISTTGLIDSLLIHILKEKHADELVVDVTDLFFAFWGTVAHKVIEKIPAKSIIFRERRLYVTINGVVVSGCPDIYYEETKEKIVNDFKTPSKKALEKGVKVGYEKQLNVYKFILVENGFPVDRLELTAFIRDARSYDQKFMHFENVKQYKHEKIREYLQKRIALLMLYKSGLLARIPECTAEERWQRQTSYSIMKLGNKKQTGKTYDTEDEATRMLTCLQKKHPKEVYEVRIKHGSNIRCENWCSVSRFCWWWQTEEAERPDSHNDIIEGTVLNDPSKTTDQIYKEWKAGVNTNV
jgi:hypothetical protein